MKDNKTVYFEKNRILKAKISYAIRPEEEELEKLKEELIKAYQATEIILEEENNPELISGYLLQIGDLVYDNSTAGVFDSVVKAVADERRNENIISVLKDKIDQLVPETQVKEIGRVQCAADGIAAVSGIDYAHYGEIVIFEDGTRGLVQNIDQEMLCMVLGESDAIEEGTGVIRTGKLAGIPVGEEVLGRVVNSLGEPIDGLGEIKAAKYHLLEREAPGVIERQPVTVPLQTGIMAIDSMFPIGRGQRELIIGDRQTGKTAIAVDTILNQRDQDVICVYVAIAQKASTIAQVTATLKKHGALSYTTVVAATASDSATLQYLAPYAGTALAEYFMEQGKDVLIIYDDLSKHAVAYRALSLLLERSPGREAYPGDVFYLHSRLLERSCRLNDELGGGSITALPIVETQEGDVSAYIPTNIISITDGQIFLESDLFFAGNRPAVNVGLSVSRVGGAAQTKAMKKAAGSLRIDLAQFKEMEAFSQFGSELDDQTRQQLRYGAGLMELLKQPLYHPRSVAEQVIILYAAVHQKFTDIEADKVRSTAQDFYTWLTEKYFEIPDRIQKNGILSKEHEKKLLEAVDEYKKVKANG